MLDEELSRALDSYLDSNWDKMLADLERLVRIESVQDMSRADEKQPYGPGPAQALEEALRLWKEYGFDSHNCEGRIGYADLPGEGKGQIGIIGHVDVVPAGEGWTFDPFAVTRKDGYLIGRGVSDDKGPMVMALHAANFWIRQNKKFPYDLRFIIGNNEETGMRDLQYYQQHFEDPDLLFSPDDEFPVCYGEKGVFQGMFTSAPIEDGVIESWQGGMAVNAVPGKMTAILNLPIDDFPKVKGISIEALPDGKTRLVAEGVQAHASTPEDGTSAIKLMVKYLLDAGVCKGAERAWLDLLWDISCDFNGSGMGLACQCPHFGALTLVGGLAGKRENCLTQSVDIRFGSLHTGSDLSKHMRNRAEACAASYEDLHIMEPFLMDKEGPLVQTLLQSYRDVTGDMQDAFTIGGATYARHFKAGASFGVDVHGQNRPSWVGAMHAADEGVAETWLKDAFKVYALAIYRLMQVDLEA